MNKDNMYEFKFYINARHYVKFGSNFSSTHPHTWEICLCLIKKDSGITQFTQTEKEIEKYMHTFDNKVLNDIEPFTEVNPTMENIGYVLFNDIDDALKDKNWLLYSLKVSENPTRGYIIKGRTDIEPLKEDMGKVSAVEPIEKNDNPKPEIKAIKEKIIPMPVQPAIKMLSNDNSIEDEMENKNPTYSINSRARRRKREQNKKRVMRTILTLLIITAVGVAISCSIYYKISANTLIHEIVKINFSHIFGKG